MILRSIFSHWGQLRDSYGTITEGSNAHWCFRRKHVANFFNLKIRLNLTYFVFWEACFFFFVIVVHESLVCPEQLNCSLFFRKILQVPQIIHFFHHFWCIWTLFNNDCMILRTIFSQLRDSYGTITEGSNAHWCFRRKHDANCNHLQETIICYLQLRDLKPWNPRLSAYPCLSGLFADSGSFNNTVLNIKCM